MTISLAMEKAIEPVRAFTAVTNFRVRLANISLHICENFPVLFLSKAFVTNFLCLFVSFVLNFSYPLYLFHTHILSFSPHILLKSYIVHLVLSDKIKLSVCLTENMCELLGCELDYTNKYVVAAVRLNLSFLFSVPL